MSAVQTDVTIPFNGLSLTGILGVPAAARGIVLFAHGSGSGRLSPRNNAVAHALQAGGFATLLMDLLTEPEATDRRLVFDIPLLAERLLGCTRWVQQNPATAPLQIGYFGASTGGGAALVAAARDPAVRAVVSRGGRPDLAGPALRAVQAPTLLIVGGQDYQVLELNEMALQQIPAPKELIIVPGATHLFEEPGALEEVARLAREWFERYVR